jgi:hypothetical protein
MSTHAVLAPEQLLIDALGVGEAEGLDDRVRLALVQASRIWQRLEGEVVGDDPMTSPYEVTVVPASAEVISAVIKMAVRFYRDPDVPFGILAAGDTGLAVRQVFPEIAPYLYGRRTRNAWGIA